MFGFLPWHPKQVKALVCASAVSFQEVKNSPCATGERVAVQLCGSSWKGKRQQQVASEEMVLLRVKIRVLWVGRTFRGLLKVASEEMVLLRVKNHRVLWVGRGL